MLYLFTFMAAAPAAAGSGPSSGIDFNREIAQVEREAEIVHREMLARPGASATATAYNYDWLRLRFRKRTAIAAADVRIRLKTDKGTAGL